MICLFQVWIWRSSMLHGRYDTQPSFSARSFDLESLVYVKRNQHISCCFGTDLEGTSSSYGFVIWIWSISSALSLLFVYPQVFILLDACGLFARFNDKRSSWGQTISFNILNYWQLNSLLIFTGMMMIIGLLLPLIIIHGSLVELIARYCYRPRH